MLKIFNNLKPFFEDNYKRIGIREYARLIKVSPPTSAQLLDGLYKEGLLNKEKEKIYIYYYANRESPVFVNLLRIYWYNVFKKEGLIDYFEEKLINPVIILFGSFSKAEINPNSDIDIALFSISKKELDMIKFSKILKRDIQIFLFKSREDIENKDLLNNILNGFIIGGNW